MATKPRAIAKLACNKLMTVYEFDVSARLKQPQVSTRASLLVHASLHIPPQVVLVFCGLYCNCTIAWRKRLSIVQIGYDVVVLCECIGIALRILLHNTLISNDKPVKPYSAIIVLRVASGVRRVEPAVTACWVSTSWYQLSTIIKHTTRF